MVNLKDFKQELAMKAFGMTREEALKKWKCINCKEEVDYNNFSEIDQHEYYISALCPDCWEEILG
jgi:DNA-directed RNA polymerase subunit RPC12/RpoP